MPARTLWRRELARIFPRMASHYVLNGQKMWITNGGFADLYTVFAKIGGEKFTAFLVERAWPGVSPGAEEKKMGLKGSSTTAVYFDNVKVPGGERSGRDRARSYYRVQYFEPGTAEAGLVRARRRDARLLADSIRYAKDRKAFGKSICEFGMIQEKLAEMAVRMYVNESMAYRVVGEIEAQLKGFSWDAGDASQCVLKAIEEFAAECSFVKIFGSEMLDFVVDEAVQIHGGYGYHQDYAVERAYRDSRINRIFEGTNEINRLLATGMLLKRAQRGTLPLVDAVKKLQATILERAGRGRHDTIANAKKIGLFLLGRMRIRGSAAKIEDQQEVMAGITDVLMNTYAMESARICARESADARTPSDMALVFAVRRHGRHRDFGAHSAGRLLGGRRVAHEPRRAAPLHETRHCGHDRTAAKNRGASARRRAVRCMIRIANGQGFWGDSLEAPVEQVRRGPLDYLTLDYLAEVTMSILQKQRARDPKLGYARDFVDMIARVLPDLKERRIRVIANAGGVNPKACRDAVLEVAKRQGIDVHVAIVAGDDIMGRLDDFSEPRRRTE